ncbi:hypothetical protein OG308_20055 [Nocardia salmonicida]|uniref:Uncharacterized protein n=1 Tax=Nocardia salmonicida TaxID=53431 RepID=A0ABZ1N161_9NOCA
MVHPPGRYTARAALARQQTGSFGLSSYREERSLVIPEHAMPRTETQLREHFERALNAARQERAVPSGLMLTLDVIGLLREIAAVSDVPETLVERARAAFEDQLSGAFAAAERERITARRRRNS